jgi:hypothetical protein
MFGARGCTKTLAFRSDFDFRCSGFGVLCLRLLRLRGLLFKHVIPTVPTVPTVATVPTVPTQGFSMSKDMREWTGKRRLCEQV